MTGNVRRRGLTVKEEERDRKREKERAIQCRRRKGTGNMRRRGLDSVGGGEGQKAGGGDR